MNSFYPLIDQISVTLELARAVDATLAGPVSFSTCMKTTGSQTGPLQSEAGRQRQLPLTGAPRPAAWCQHSLWFETAFFTITEPTKTTYGHVKRSPAPDEQGTVSGRHDRIRVISSNSTGVNQSHHDVDCKRSRYIKDACPTDMVCTRSASKCVSLHAHRTSTRLMQHKHTKRSTSIK